MDWGMLVKSASEPDLLRSEFISTLRAADEAQLADDRAEATRRIEEAYALSDHLTLLISGEKSGRLFDSEETST
jgi:hypothetical protein